MTKESAMALVKAFTVSVQDMADRGELTKCSFHIDYQEGNQTKAVHLSVDVQTRDQVKPAGYR